MNLSVKYQKTECANAMRDEGPSGITDNVQQFVNATIMIVDDEAITMEVVQTFLEEEGYRNFVLIEDSNQAMQVIEEMRPDILLLDLFMPDVSGFDILAEIRDHQKLKHLPVIILTASSDTDNKLHALDLGATDFLTKPVDPSELRLRVRNTLAAKAFVDQLAYYDSLTELPNRRMFIEHLDWNFKLAQRKRECLALLSIELDQFDKISDTIGLLAGDEILRQVSVRIQNVIKNLDMPGYLNSEDVNDVNLSRFDSSIFSLCLYRLHSERDSALVAERILDSIKKPMIVEGAEFYVTASIGIATYPTEKEDCVTLLQLASSARGYAKDKGGDCFEFSSRKIKTQYRKRLSFEASLRKALDRDELLLYYQPKVDVATNGIRAVEALLRWRKGDEGVILPDKFISLAEEIGLIYAMGEWVLYNACSQLKEWEEKGKLSMGMAVNLSPIQFLDRELPTLLERVIEHSAIDPKLLTLEITESMLMNDIENKITMMNRLRETGLKLSIDDFGTGYSSLNYLRKLPVDELKIDRSFLTDLTESRDSRAIVSSMLYLSRKLGLQTVVEGVETKEQLEFLQKECCDQYQGFLFSPPISNTELFALLPSDC